MKVDFRSKVYLGRLSWKSLNTHTIHKSFPACKLFKTHDNVLSKLQIVPCGCPTSYRKPV